MRRDIVCWVCGDQDVGPWAFRGERMLCEACLDAVNALATWAAKPGLATDVGLSRIGRLATDEARARRAGKGSA